MVKMALYIALIAIPSLLQSTDWDAFKQEMEQKSGLPSDMVCKPLHEAAIKINLDEVKRLVEQGANVNEIGCFWKMTPIQAGLFEWKTTQDSLEAIRATTEYLITKKAEAFQYFQKEVKVDFLGDKNIMATIVSYLLDHGAMATLEYKEDGFGRTALHIAAMYGHGPSVTVLCQKGANKEAKDIDDSTPLHLACMNNHADAAKALVQQGANMQSKQRTKSIALANDPQPIPIHIAAFKGYADIIEIFLKAGLNVDVADALKETALMYAAENDRAAAVKLLLAYNANPNLQDSKGKTALHYAASQLNKEIIELLLAKGARKDIKDIKGINDTEEKSPIGRAVDALTQKNPNITEQEILNNPIIQLLKYK